MKIKDDFAKRKIAGTIIVVPIGENSLKFNGMITLNESGAFFWDCFVEDCTIDEAVQKVLAEYDVDEATARRDIEKFVDMLKQNDIME